MCQLLYFYITVKQYINSFFQTKTPGKRGRPARNTPGRKKKQKTTDEDDDVDEEEKEHGSKPRAPTPAKPRGRAAKGKAKKEEPEVEPEEEEEFEEDEIEDEEEDDDEEDEDVEEEEEELNQGPNAKPAKKFTVYFFQLMYATKYFTKYATVNFSLVPLLSLKLICLVKAILLYGKLMERHYCKNMFHSNRMVKYYTKILQL